MQLSDDYLEKLIAARDAAIYRLVDYRIARGIYPVDERERRFAEIMGLCLSASSMNRTGTGCND